MMGRSDPPETAHRPIEPGADIARFPASRWQRFFWPAANDPRQATALNVAMRWRIIGDFSDVALEAALTRAIARHEILRTRFEGDGDSLDQIITEHGHVRLGRIDLQRLAPESREAEAERIAAQTAHEPFNPSEASLIRALSLRLSASEAILCLTLSRLIIDGWSINLVLDEVARDASADGAYRPIAVELHYGDYTLWQDQAVRGEAAQAEAQAWRDRLKDFPGGFTLAEDVAATAADIDADAIHSLPLDRTASAAFDTAAHDLGVTTFQLGAAILATTLARLTGAPRIAFSTEVASREEPMAESIVGPLINLLPLSFCVDARKSVAANVRAAALEMRACLAGENIPFANLDLAPEHRALLPKLHFVLQKSYISADDSADPDFGRFRLQSLPSLSTGALWDLNFFMVQRGGVWRLSVERRAGLFGAATVQALLTYWRDVMRAALANPEIAVENLPAPDPTLQRPARFATPPGIEAAPPAARLRHSAPALMALNIAQVYFPLARAFGDDLAFFDCPLETPESPPPQRYFIDIARDCVAQVRAARAQGPYILFGFCVAGALALETARLLRAEGEAVPLVVLCDTWRPGFREELRGLDRSIRLMQIRRALWAKHRAKLRSGELDWSYVLRTWPFARALALADIGEWLGLIKHGAGHTRLEAENRVLADHLHDSQTRFRPKPYDGDVLIFRSEEALTGRLFPRDFDWSRVLTGTVEVIDCPGQHDEMFRPAGVCVISAAIRSKLAQLSVSAS